MHLQKVSALAVQIGFTAASVVGGAVPEDEIMGRRDWRDDRDAALKVAADAQARTDELAKKYRDRDTVLLTTPIVAAAQVEDSQAEKRQFGGFGGFGNKDNGDDKKQGWFGNKQGGGLPGGGFPGGGAPGGFFGGNQGGKGGQGGQGGWQQQAAAGKKVAEDAKARANAIADAYRKQFGQGGAQKRQTNAEAANAAGVAAAANANANAAAKAFNAAGDPNAAANAAAAGAAVGMAAMPNNGNNNNQGDWNNNNNQGPDWNNANQGDWNNNNNNQGPDWNNNQGPDWNNNPQAAGGDWQSVAASAQNLASSYASQYNAPVDQPQTWASYGASLAAPAESHIPVPVPAPGGDHGNEGAAGDWHATATEAVASANSVAASYRSEYPAPAPAAPTHNYGEGAAHGTGAGVVYPSATHMVEVNGASAGRAGLVGATVVGAGMAFLAVAFGRL